MRAILMGIGLVCYCAVGWGGSEKPLPQQNFSWGKLFFTAPQRAQLIQKKQQISLQETLSYQGIVLSAGKAPTYWLNNTMQQSLPTHIRRQQTRLMIQQGEQSLLLQPGERYEMTDSNTHESTLEKATP